ncbi:hypothetical protein GH741_13660 [Aquibacillus halophilus]|uniref:Uncharacterized protein n=1 Tax=Aquibacillus halophilus TaxID=930132 RepID=A0A6A8DIT9_9BACI|nr:hypothetical protein [Aquibacillus halophilus]MRH43719.1 hypothetical protein [Aquibacillus halophilus]
MEAGEAMKVSITYIISKFAAAGITFSLFYLVSLMISNWDFASSNDLLKNPYIWLCFFGYAVISSILIDYLLKRNGKTSWFYSFIYYTIASVVIWLLLFLPSISDFFYYLAMVLYAGFITVWCSWAYLVVYRLIKRRSGLSIGLMVVSLLFLLAILFFQPSIQNGWQQSTTENSYHASFDLFSGEEKIEVDLEGERIYQITLNWSISEGGHGWKVRGKDDYVKLEETDTATQYLLHTTYAGPYYFFVSGNKAKGNVDVSWVEVIR